MARKKERRLHKTSSKTSKLEIYYGFFGNFLVFYTSSCFCWMKQVQSLLNRKSMNNTLEKMLMDREYCGATECLEFFVNSGDHTVAVQDTLGTSV